MITEEKEFNNFIAYIAKEAKELWDKYDKLSDNNKRKFLLYVEPLVCAGGIQGFINQMNNFFNTGIR